MYHQFNISKPQQSKTTLPYPGQQEFMYLTPQQQHNTNIESNQYQTNGGDHFHHHQDCSQPLQTSFHTLHNTYQNMTNNSRPMVIHTKMVNVAASSPSSKTSAQVSSSSVATHQQTEKPNSSGSSSSDDSSSNNLLKDKYKRPCPSESYRNIAASLTLDEISRHYHLTRQDACTALKVSWRDLKERLNILGVIRWPKTNAKKVTQFNATTSQFEQMCSVIETVQPVQKKKKQKTAFNTTPMILNPNPISCTVVQQSHQPVKPVSSCKASVKSHTTNLEKNPCLSPNNGSTCSLSCPSTTSNISINVQPQQYSVYHKSMNSPKSKVGQIPKTIHQPTQHLPVYYGNQTAPIQQTNTYQVTPTKSDIYRQTSQSRQSVPHTERVHSNTPQSHSNQQSLPHISSFFEEMPSPPTSKKTESVVQYPNNQILPSISSFDTYFNNQNNLKRGRVESDDFALNKKRII